MLQEEGRKLSGPYRQRASPSEVQNVLQIIKKADRASERVACLSKDVESLQESGKSATAPNKPELWAILTRRGILWDK